MKCIKCEKDMIENFKLSSNGLKVIMPPFATPISELKCAICPNCGHVEFYATDMEKLNKLISKKE